jgi:peptidoglycan hydrolase-like protein with peptidoglycan-binding domain
VQERLKAHGIDTGPIDGMFGPMTDSAVRKFQRLNFLPATGKVNSATWEALLT